MAIFDIFNSNKPLQSPVVNPEHYKQEEELPSYFGFSTPFGVIGKGNLTLPFVDKAFAGAGFVRFGSDNLYPQLLNQLYYMSPSHKACINYKIMAICGGGYTIDTTNANTNEKIDIKKFEYASKLQQIYKHLTSDYTIHNRINLLIYTNSDGKITKFERIDPAKVRANENRTKFIVSDDWSKGYTNVKTYKNYEVDSKDSITMYEYCMFSPGQDIYPIADYNSILNNAALTNDISFFMKNYMKNSVNFAGMVNFPQVPKSFEEKQNNKKMFDNGKGAENAGNIFVTYSPGKDNMPEYKEFKLPNNYDMFPQTIKLLNEEICIGHNIDPILLGIRIQGSLGQSSEQPFAYAKFKKLVVEPMRKDLEYAINFILMMSGIKYTFKFNEYDIITAEMLNGGETSKTETTEDIEMSIDEKSIVNDNLKGLSAKENMDIIRIIRDFNKDKLNYELAEYRLLSYGLPKEVIKTILKKK